jgi:hypothetical protein
MFRPRTIALTTTLTLAYASAVVAVAPIYAQGGRNVVIGSDAAQSIAGTAGDDALYGLAGDDRLDGRDGDDDLDGGAGADELTGGAGDDVASYAGATGPVRVTFDDQADDGSPGERDNIRRDVENAYGGADDDELIGDGRDNTLDGGPGNDRLVGGGGGDGLFGGPGDDVIDAKDGVEDEVDCGSGDADRVLADPGDAVDNCEGTVSPAPRRTRIPIRSYFTVPTGISTSAACRGRVRLQLRRGKRVLANGTARLAPSGRRCTFKTELDVRQDTLGSATRIRCRVKYSGVGGLRSDTFNVWVDVPR